MVRNAYSLRPYCLAVALLLCLLSFKVVLVVIIGGVLTLCALLYLSVSSTFVAIDPLSPRKLKSHAQFLDSGSAPFNWNDAQFALSHPNIAQLIEEIVDLIVESYIMSWFQHIDVDSHSAFPIAVKKIVLEAIVKLQASFDQVDEGKLIFLKLLPLLAKHFETFCVSKEAVVSDLMLEKSNSQNFDLQVAAEYNKVSKLHHSLSLRTTYLGRDVSRYMTAKVEQILPFLINEKELSSSYVSVLLRDVFASCILTPLIIKLSEADFWNVTLTSLSDKILEEQDQVHVIRKFLSKEVEQQENDLFSEADLKQNFDIERELSPGLSGPQFENYLRQISQLTSFEELQRARFLLITKLMRLKKEECLTKNLIEYRRRLILSLNLLQTRLRFVDPKTADDRSRQLNLNFTDADKAVHKFQVFMDTISLDDILKEQRCTVYFERYLNMKSSTRGLCYLRFWRIVETMKNPLEDGGEDVSVAIQPSEVAQLRDFACTFFQGEQLDNMTLLDAGLVTNITLFIKSSNYNTNSTFPLARRSILLLQSEARRALDRNFFQTFKMSMEFLNMLSNSDFTNTELYSKLVIDPQQGEERRKLRTAASLSSIRIFSSPGIDDALETLLTKRTAQRRHSLQQTIRNSLFGDEDSGVFNDALFEEEEDCYEETMSSALQSLEEDALSVSTTTGTANQNGSLKTLGKFSDNLADLKEDIAKLSMAIDQIEKQLELLDHLILKADLTNNQNQLKLLKKSKRALIRDLDAKELTKQQLMVQQNANSLYKKTKIAIKSYYMDSHYREHREVIYYLINVDHIHQGQATSWEIPRRFSEFYKLNSYLKKKYNSSMRSLIDKDSFPKKMKMSLKFHVSKSLLYQERTIKLERYLKELLNIPQICQDDMLRKFLTDNSAFNIVSTEREDLISDEQEQCNALEDSMSSHSSGRDFTPQLGVGADFKYKQLDNHPEEVLNMCENDWNCQEGYGSVSNTQNKPIVKAICDFFILVFSLNKTNAGWLRGRAIITVLQQLLGSAIEKYAMESMKKLRSETHISRLLINLKLKMWPNGKLMQRKQIDNQRSEGELKRARADSLIMLQCLFTELFGKVVGLQNAQVAATNIHDMIQNSYLNANLLLEIMDLLFDELPLFENQKNKNGRSI